MRNRGKIDYIFFVLFIRDENFIKFLVKKIRTNASDLIVTIT